MDEFYGGLLVLSESHLVEKRVLILLSRNCFYILLPKSGAPPGPPSGFLYFIYPTKRTYRVLGFEARDRLF